MMCVGCCALNDPNPNRNTNPTSDCDSNCGLAPHMRRFRDCDKAVGNAVQHLKSALGFVTGAKSGDVNPMKLAGYVRKISVTELVFAGVANEEANWLLHSTGTAGANEKAHHNSVRG